MDPAFGGPERTPTPRLDQRRPVVRDQRHQRGRQQSRLELDRNLVAWDDWGGFYDHVTPPTVDQNGYGLRVPGLLVSPYAKQGYVDHQTLSFDAYLKFIEDDFLGGQRLDPANDGRPDTRPTVRESSSVLGDLASEFDFNQVPRPPLLLAAHPTTTLTNVPPYPPRAITVAGGNGQATVGWTAPMSAGGSPITSYKLVPYDGTAMLPALTYPANATSGTVTNLTNGDTFTFKVFATNTVGKGMLSVATPTVTIGTPSAPPTVSATPGNGNAIMGWKAPTSANGSAITGYRVTPRTGFFTLASVTFPASARSGAVPGLTNGTAYTFTVAALNARGVGATKITPTVRVGSPTAPTGVGGTPGPGTGAITVHWSPPTSTNGAAITGYIVTTRYKSNPTATKTVAATPNTVTITGLTSGTSYSFVVNTINARGTGAQSLSTPEIVAP